MDFSIDHYLQARFSTLARPDLPMPTGKPEEWAAWRNRLTRVLHNVIGGLPVARPLSGTRVMEQSQLDGVLRLRIALDSDSALPIPCYVLMPMGEKKMRPGVIALHSEGCGSRSIVGLADKEDAAKSPCKSGDFALGLAKQGYVVIAPDLFGYGERRMKAHQAMPMDQASSNQASAYLWMLGETVLGLRIWDVMRCLDYFMQCEDVDHTRIGLMGAGIGAMVGLFAAALDKRIAAVVLNGYFNTFLDGTMAQQGSMDQYLYGILLHADLPDIAGLIAPRPLLIQGDKEQIGGVYTGYRRLKEGYRTLEAEQKLALDVADENGASADEKAGEFLSQWLMEE